MYACQARHLEVTPNISRSCMCIAGSFITSTLRTYLHQNFQICRYTIPNIQTPILAWLIRNLQHPIHLPLVHTNTSRKLHQPFVGLVSPLVYNIYIEIIILVFKQFLTEFPKSVWRKLQYRNASFMYKGRRRMPRLDLLAEDQLDVIGVRFRRHGGQDGFVNRVKHFCRKLREG